MIRGRHPIHLLMYLLLCSGTAGAADDLPYMATISIERAAGAAETFDATLQSVLHVNDPEKLARNLADVDGLEVIASDQDTVTVQHLEKPTFGGGAPGQFEQSTWVIDFDEESVQLLVTSLAAELEAPPSIDVLEAFVFEHITNKSYARSFDLASQVAASGEGDCSEHAVLLTALARAYGWQARVVIGNLIVDDDAGLFAFGHAWAEIHNGEHWQIWDATLPNIAPSVKQLRYLPIAVLSDEGPGYGLAMIGAVLMMPARISGVANLQ